MIEHYNDDDPVRHLLDTYNWHFLPVANPDGYVHTWESEVGAIQN